jgi:hypothetical protein
MSVISNVGATAAKYGTQNRRPTYRVDMLVLIFQHTTRSIQTRRETPDSSKKAALLVLLGTRHFDDHMWELEEPLFCYSPLVSG